MATQLKAAFRLRAASKPSIPGQLSVGDIEVTTKGSFGSHGSYVGLTLQTSRRVTPDEVKKIQQAYGKPYDNRPVKITNRGSSSYFEILLEEKSFKFSIDPESSGDQF